MSLSDTKLNKLWSEKYTYLQSITRKVLPLSEMEAWNTEPEVGDNGKPLTVRQSLKKRGLRGRNKNSSDYVYYEFLFYTWSNEQWVPKTYCDSNISYLMRTVMQDFGLSTETNKAEDSEE